jgi:hypothetical protein
MGARFLGTLVNEFLEPLTLKLIAVVLLVVLAWLWFVRMRQAEPPIV